MKLYLSQPMRKLLGKMKANNMHLVITSGGAYIAGRDGITGLDFVNLHVARALVNHKLVRRSPPAKPPEKYIGTWVINDDWS
jgi:hypothetical protein